MKTLKTIFTIALISAVMNSFAWVDKDKALGSQKNGTPNPTITAGCVPATSYDELTINNIRAKVSTGGDMWYFNGGPGAFEVPKGSGRNCMYSGALWLGGMDVSGQLKVAALVYRVYGEDFWPGPLSTITSEITPETCTEYDKFYRTTKDEVLQFASWFDAGVNDVENGTNTQSELFPDYSIPESILNWPAHGRNYEPYNEDLFLAPFYDNNLDGVYDPYSGDYPGYDLKNEKDCSQRKVSIYGDENLWWVFNDKGNVHTASGANSIGMEIRAQTFGFATNDEVNNMLFYNYELVNRSTFTLTDTYFGIFADSDIGGYEDDYVGCDVMRGLGYCYNGDNEDSPAQGSPVYEGTPPAIGIDFFEGPFQDNDGIDNAKGIGQDEALNGVGYGDGVVDNERFGMRRFIYFNRQGANFQTDPSTGAQFYNYMRGLWKDGSKMIYGGNGHTANASEEIEADFMFPDKSDPLYWGTMGVPVPEWTEVTANNSPADRRFLQSAGPFTLTPGAINNITVGVVWTKAEVGGNLASVELLKIADEKTQAMFDNCFRVLNGPDAPDLLFQELDKELILTISNERSCNNYGDTYEEVSTFIIPPESIDTDGDSINDYELTDADKTAYKSYKFQGYKIYQVKDKTVDASALSDPSKARLIYQCDIQDNVSQIINYEFNQALGSAIPVEKVNGDNKGVQHVISVTEDQFSTGDKRLVNHKTYYFIGMAYAYNNHTTYNPNKPNPKAQLEPYIESRKSCLGAIRPFPAIPHNTALENNGTVLNSKFGDEIPLTRIEGLGNSGYALHLKTDSIEELFKAPYILKYPTYEKGASPLKIRVIDPLNVIGDNFTIAFNDTNSTTMFDLTDARWKMWRHNPGTDETDTVLSINTISSGFEQVIPEWGISVNVGNVKRPGEEDNAATGENGYIDSWVTYKDESKAWLTGVSDGEGTSNLNWIRSGTNNNEAPNDIYNDYLGLDDAGIYENILGGSWAPTRLTSNQRYGPLMPSPNVGSIWIPSSKDHLKYLHGVDIVITSDKTKWTRCPVIEQQEEITLSHNQGEKGRLRMAPSVDKEGRAYADWPANEISSSTESDPNYMGAHGMGWFPGYAIDVETGERLNMAFGEDSWLQNQNGRDMIWNPTENLTAGFSNDLRGGGRHVIYVFRNNIVEDETGIPYIMSDPTYRMPSYDAGEFLFAMLNKESTETSSQKLNKLQAVYRAALWTGWNILTSGHSLFETDVTFSIRVKRPFERFSPNKMFDASLAPENGKEYLVHSGPILFKGKEYNRGETIIGDGVSLVTLIAGGGSGSSSSFEVLANVISEVINGGLPLYNFNTHDYAASTGRLDIARDMLDQIRVVPNPYYAYSEYEKDKLDNRVKIVNLPEKCSVSIYTLDGILIRQYQKDDPTMSSIDWDLKNTVKIPISSGVYIVYVAVPGIGTKTVRWFGTLRPVDLDQF